MRSSSRVVGSGGGAPRDDDTGLVLLGMVAPAVVTSLLGVGSRAMATGGSVGWFVFATLALYAGLTILAWRSLRRARSRALRALLLGCGTAVAVPLFALEFTQLLFVRITGAALGPELLLYGLRSSDDAIHVTWSLVGPQTLFLPFLHLLLIAVLVVRTRAWTPSAREAEPVRQDRLAAAAAAALIGLPSILGPGSLPVMRMPAVVYLATGALALPTTPPPQVAQTPPPLVRKVRATETPNLVVVLLESTSWSSTTLASPELQTTPYLAQLAERSLVAQRAHPVVPHTTKAAVSVVCGYAPRLTIEVTEAGPDGLHHPCLPHLLRPFGYESAFFRSATGRFEGWTQLLGNEGFDHVVVSEDLDTADWHRVNLFGFEDDILLEPSRSWLEAREGRPFLAVYLTGTPHYEYALPDEHVVERFVEEDEQNRHLNGIRYVDDFLRKLVAQYQDLGLYENTVFLVVGDHGEAFGEHGRWQHDSVPWDEVARIPLVLHVPGRTWDRPVVREGVSQLDIAPTLLDLAGFELEGGPYEGTPIHEVDAERRLFFHCWYPSMCAATLRGARKVIDHHDLRPLELFDRDADPEERVNLAAQATDEVRAELEALRRWSAEVEARYEERRRHPVPLDDLVRIDLSGVDDALVSRADEAEPTDD